MDFQKVVYENIRKKNIHFTANVSKYMGHRHFVLRSFILYIL